MQVTDAVKLLYQRVFGGGHLIKDRKSCIDYLAEEYSAAASCGVDIIEHIGGGMVRFNLSAAKREGIPPLLIAEEFIESANRPSGNIAEFKALLQTFSESCEQGVLLFPADSVHKYLKEYAASGYPMVSHSEVYRKLYKPAYRVMREENAKRILKGCGK